MQLICDVRACLWGNLDVSMQMKANAWQRNIIRKEQNSEENFRKPGAEQG